ncbi:uncharacterized protein LOC120338495 [Styela clava]
MGIFFKLLLLTTVFAFTLEHTSATLIQKKHNKTSIAKKFRKQVKIVLNCTKYCEWNHYIRRYLGRCMFKDNKDLCKLCRRLGCKSGTIFGDESWTDDDEFLLY